MVLRIPWPGRGDAVNAGAKSVYVAVGGVVLAIIAVALFWTSPSQDKVAPARPDHMAHPLPNLPSIAVLPFEWTKPNSKKYNFAINIGESVTIALSRLPQVFVMDTRAGLSLVAPTPVEPGKAAEKLAVRYILQGGVEGPNEAGDDPVLRVALIDAIEGIYLWQDEIELDDQSYLDLRDEILEAVLESLKIEIAEKDLAHALRRDIGEQEIADYLRASRIDWSHFEARSNNRTIADSKTWIKRKPDQGALQVHLAWGYWAKLAHGWTYGQPGSYKRMADAAAAALSLGPDYPPAHGIQAVVKIWGGDTKGAFRACERAVALAPSNADIAFDCGLVYLLAGQYDTALAQTKRGFRLYPEPLIYRYDTLSEIHRVRGESKEMRKIDEWIVKHDTRPWLTVPARLRMAVADADSGDLDGAKKRLARIREIAPDISADIYRQNFRYRNKTVMEKFYATLKTLQTAP